jgi:DNA-binding NarL/FixJ family response regulator
VRPVALAVLLVDDVEQLRFLVRRALQVRGGFDVVAEAADGRTAIEAAAKLQPDVVVLDLGLPDLAGRDVLTMLRVAAPDMRVVVFTGGDATEKVSVATEVEGFVLKGETVKYLVDLLDDMVGGTTSSMSLYFWRILWLLCQRAATFFLYFSFS